MYWKQIFSSTQVGDNALQESPNYCESLDSLQTETTTFDKLSFMPFPTK